MKVVILLFGLAVISAAPLDEDQKAVQDQDLPLIDDDIQDAAGNSLDSYDRRLYKKVSYFQCMHFPDTFKKNHFYLLNRHDVTRNLNFIFAP